VINGGGWAVLFGLKSVPQNETMWPYVHNVVFKNIVCHVPLHLELAGSCSRGVVFIERIVDHRGMIGTSSLRRIASDGNTRGIAVIYKIVSCRDVTGCTVLVLACQFDSEVHIVNDVLFG
jgi:hypothetical protein